jgi:uncharacterized protein YhfF/broad specificity phosphatase PhoE
LPGVDCGLAQSMSQVIYITHPEVVIDPDIPVPQWPLSAVGAERMRLFSRNPALGGAKCVWCSTQTKAQLGARILGEALNLPVVELQELGENDRSSTGYVAPPRFWELVDVFFSRPDESVEGWENARHAQARTMQAIDHVIANSPEGDILIVGHGGVGRLALASLRGELIERSVEQQGQGNWFSFDRETRRLISSWQPLPRDPYASAQTFSFGDSPEMADELLALVIAGTKTATCGVLRDLPPGSPGMPVVGRRDVVLDGRGNRAAVIETLEVTIRRFDEVDEAFAHDEGEGFRTLEDWRKGHQKYFERNGGFSPDMELVCERFRLVEALDRTAM